jgi:hypothetical protein
MFSFFRQKPKEPPLIQKDPDKVRTCMPCRKLSPISRLNIFSQLTSMIDTAYGLAIKDSTFNNFVKTSFPFSLSYYLLPSFIIPIATLSCTVPPLEYNDDAAELLNELVDDDAVFHQFLIEHPEEIRHLLENIQKYQQKYNTDKIDTAMNVIYLFTRSVRGVIVFLDMFKIASDDTKNTMSDLATFSYSIFNLAFMCFTQMHNLYKIHKKNKLNNDLYVLFSNTMRKANSAKDIEAQKENPLVTRVSQTG